MELLVSLPSHESVHPLVLRAILTQFPVSLGMRGSTNRSASVITIVETLVTVVESILKISRL